MGGAIVFAKTSKAASLLSDMIRRRVIKRTDLTVVHGVPRQKQGQLEDYLLKDSRKNIVPVESVKHPDVKQAILDYQVLESKEGFSLLAVQLHTGVHIKFVFN